MVKRFLPCLVASFALPLLSAQADLTIVQEVKQAGLPQATDVTVTTLTKGHLARVNINPEMSSIVDLGTGDTISLGHSAKIAVKVSGDVLKKMQAGSAHLPPATLGPLTDTGAKETINGFATEKYETTLGTSQAEIWLTQDAPDAQKAMNDLAALGGDSSPFAGILKKQNLPGFPVQVIIHLPQGGTVTSTIISLKSAPLPDSDFAIPAGYAIHSLPDR